ncbi:MAG TPA: D-amino-acid oxidase, partial [Ruegeria sp.]|nr:D-amino-acid oxidase [Ruegeria sp.]
MPGPRPTDFYSDLALPKQVEVVVVGGGIIGVSAALELAERGVSVLLCEKGQIGAEQSSRNWGWVRLGMRDPREIPLMQAALEIWDGLDDRLGRSTGFVRSGILFAASGRRSVGNLERWARHVDGLETRARMIEGAELAAHLPGHSKLPRAALFMPQDGRAEPQWAAPAVAEGTRDRGAQILTACAVRSVDVEAGQVTGVYTERGRVACSRVILAGGAWSRLFAGNAG